MAGIIKMAFLRKKQPKLSVSSDRDIYYEYRAKEEAEVLIRQDYIRAAEIDCGEDAISEQDFPWHGHSYQDFLDVTNRLQRLLPEILAICGDKEIKRFQKRHADVYEAYYRCPIHILLEDGKYKILGDGRHRIFTAAQTDSVIPVFIVEYAVVREMTVEGFLERNCWRSWRF